MITKVKIIKIIKNSKISHLGHTAQKKDGDLEQNAQITDMVLKLILEMAELEEKLYS